MPAPGRGKRRKGTPLDDVTRASNGVGRPVQWRVPRAEHEAFHALTEARGMAASELARDIVDAAARETGSVEPASDDYAYLSARMPHEAIAQLSAAAGACELEPVAWLRLITTSAGDVLLRQLQAAKRVRSGR